ncbi:hypothetical protein TNCV_2976771 [Trichonephila clavipes]|nr:hypothetical protein TNCV_2976771 [Trichonephila clavipes]
MFIFDLIVPMYAENYDNRLTMTELVARVAAIVGDHRCHTLRFKETGCVLGVQQTKQLAHITKVDLVWQLGVLSGSIVEQPWTTCFLSAKDPESEPSMEAIQSGD